MGPAAVGDLRERRGRRSRVDVRHRARQRERSRSVAEVEGRAGLRGVRRSRIHRHGLRGRAVVVDHDRRDARGVAQHVGATERVAVAPRREACLVRRPGDGGRAAVRAADRAAERGRLQREHARRETGPGVGVVVDTQVDREVRPRVAGGGGSVGGGPVDGQRPTGRSEVVRAEQEGRRDDRAPRVASAHRVGGRLGRGRVPRVRGRAVGGGGGTSGAGVDRLRGVGPAPRGDVGEGRGGGPGVDARDRVDEGERPGDVRAVVQRGARQAGVAGPGREADDLGRAPRPRRPRSARSRPSTCGRPPSRCTSRCRRRPTGRCRTPCRRARTSRAARGRYRRRPSACRRPSGSRCSRRGTPREASRPSSRW